MLQRNPAGHGIPVGFLRDGKQFHCSSRDWHETGEKRQKGEGGTEIITVGQILEKYAVLI